MPHPFFDALKFPLHRLDARELHKGLYETVGSPAQIDLLYRKCAEGLMPLTPAPPHAMWVEALDNLTAARALRQLFDLVLAAPSLAAIHSKVHAARDAIDAVQQMFLRGDTLFLDRVNSVRRPGTTSRRSTASPTSRRRIQFRWREEGDVLEDAPSALLRDRLERLRWAVRWSFDPSALPDGYRYLLAPLTLDPSAPRWTLQPAERIRIERWAPRAETGPRWTRGARARDAASAESLAVGVQSSAPPLRDLPCHAGSAREPRRAPRRGVFWTATH